MTSTPDVLETENQRGQVSPRGLAAAAREVTEWREAGVYSSAGPVPDHNGPFDGKPQHGALQ